MSLFWIQAVPLTYKLDKKLVKLLTTNSLVFDAKKMSKWWSSGYEYAHKRDKLNSSEFRTDIIDI